MRGPTPEREGWKAPSVPRSDIHDIRTLTDTGPITIPIAVPRAPRATDRPARDSTV